MAVLFLIPLMALVSCGDDDPVSPAKDPQCEVLPGALDFGTVAVGGDPELSFTIRNTRSGTLTGDVAETCGHYSIVSGGGAFALDGGDSVVVTVRFEPADEGTHTCTITTGVTACGSVLCTGDAQFAWEQIYSNSYYTWRAIWGSSADDIFVVGGDIRHYDGFNWETMTNPSDKSLYGVWGSGPDNVYAVGREYSTSVGVIVHYNGTSWNIVEDDLPVGFLGIWGSGPDDIYAVGLGHNAYHYTGSSWETVGLGGIVTHAVWGTAWNDVFFVGDTGRIRHYDGTTMETMTSNTSYALLGVWGASSTEVFVTTFSSLILAYTGSTWEPMQNDGTGGRLEDIWGTSATDIYCAGYSRRIMRFDGSSWKDMINPTTQTLLGIWGSSATNIYAVGERGVIQHYTGQ